MITISLLKKNPICYIKIRLYLVFLPNSTLRKYPFTQPLYMQVNDYCLNLLIVSRYYGRKIATNISIISGFHYYCKNNDCPWSGAGSRDKHGVRGEAGEASREINAGKTVGIALHTPSQLLTQLSVVLIIIV